MADEIRNEGAGHDLASTLTAQLSGAGGFATNLVGDEEPNVLMVHPDLGLVAIDIEYDASPGDASTFLLLNEKVHALRQTLSIDASVPFARVVLHPEEHLSAPARGVGGRLSISRAQLANTSWLEELKPQPINEELRERVARLLHPTFTFTTTFRKGATDDGHVERERMRVRLDASQASIAQREKVDLAIISGPPGSGKTLVLAARARWLSNRHPEWRIKFLCFNNALVPYLRNLVGDCANVEVMTMWPFSKAFGVGFSFDDHAGNLRRLAQARMAGKPPIADAILLDEVQDFASSWLAIVHAALVPNRGGLFMAGDRAQALYGVNELPDFMRSGPLEKIELKLPYRSTRSILGAIGGFGNEFSVSSQAQAPEGEPVELIWANSPSEQANAIAWEIQLMLRSHERQPGDIGILIPTYKGTLTHICPALEHLDIPFEAIVSKDDKSGFDRTTNTVKIITPHSAKGHEFPVVFLFGLDTLKSFDPADEKAVQLGRAGFVGATRAKDQLLITYTKHNSYLDILSADDTFVRRWLWPDHYDGVPQNG